MASKIIVNLDTSKEIYLAAKCKQNDDLILEASIYENGKALDLTNKEMVMQALKANNTYIIQNTEIAKENNKIVASLDRDFTRVPGTTKIEIVLTESGKQNTTFSFYLEVVGSVIRGAVESTNNVTILEKLQNNIILATENNLNLKDNVKSAIIENTSATKNIENLNVENSNAVSNIEDLNKENIKAIENVSAIEIKNVEATNNITELTNKLVEAAVVKEETEQLVTSGGAATKGEVQQINASLEQKTDLVEMANSNQLIFTNAYGNSENIHPKVIKLDTPINGYSYWMAYTPYPSGSIDKENPSIACSKNAIDWVTPIGLTNPVIDTPTDNTVGKQKAYNSDTHLLYVNEKFEMWYRYSNETTSVVKIFRVTSTDGVVWTTPELLITTNLNSGDMLSPAILYEDNKYKMWYVSHGDDGYYVRYKESSDALAWSENKILSIDFGTRVPWHIDVIKSDDKGYELLVQCKPDRLTSNSIDNVLMYTKSLNNITFDKPFVVMKPSGKYNSFDGYSLYRSSLIRMFGRYYIYYSAISHTGNRGMGLAVGNDIMSLKGASLGRVEKVQLPFGVENTNYKQEFKTDSGWKACLRFSKDKEMMLVDEFSLQNLINLLVNEISLRNVGGKRTTLKSADSLNSTLQIIRTLADNSQISGGLQAGLLYLEDSSIGLGNGLSLKEGAVRYNATNKGVDVYDGTQWISTLNGLTKTVTAPTILTDYDIKNVKTILVNGTGTVTFNSFINAVKGQSVNIVVTNGTANITFVYSSSLVTPKLTNFTVSTDNIGVTLVATDTNLVRVF
ncbi:BppU family phage baseplate upper protein [Clostridium tertium]|uniref:BppU family phage baseplate upper protein n=1 Tax=Clostridium tertium TaxID=1559 RepID=UPI0024B33B28|nr:BppU family phage baseplate upper protein [Clostridium tertium]MDI9215939.1 hypothetical protein [Clostridium tertium]